MLLGAGGAPGCALCTVGLCGCEQPRGEEDAAVGEGTRLARPLLLRVQEPARRCHPMSPAKPTIPSTSLPAVSLQGPALPPHRLLREGLREEQRAHPRLHAHLRHCHRLHPHR